MIRARDKKLLAAAAVAVIAVVVIVMSSREDKDVGSLTVTTKLTNGQGIAELDYKISGNGITPITGRTPVGDPPLSVKDLPSANGYVLELTATSGDGKTKCSRRDNFDVVMDTTTSVAAVVFCRDLNRIARFVENRKAAVAGKAVAERAPAPAMEVAPECTSCEKAGIAGGQCEPDSGCEGLSGEDKDLCVNLVNCMRATNCWVRDPLDCLCGTAKDVACTTDAANGACRAEMQAATRSTDPIKNGTLFYDPTVPAGRANRLLACDRDQCTSHCSL
jgi:hypothetical protein